MTCPGCRREPPSDAEFCPSCGIRLVLECRRCGTENAADHDFCKKCGQPLRAAAEAAGARFMSPHSYTPRHLAEKILTSRSALEGERKQVTVLFADVSGFTSLSERLDPEQVHGLISRTFDVMLAEVHRYDGTVNQFLGDGIMALFGAPVAHEDHAQRAVHAALGMRRALEAYADELGRERGIRLRIRQGLNTGLVVVGSIGSDLRMDYTAVGDTTNVAARMQQAAEPGSILIADATHRLVADYFSTRSLGELAVKGKSALVVAWEVLGVRSTRSRVEAAAQRGLTPFVGRQRELRLLSECFEQAKTGRGQVVFVVGEPGIGKSRLLHEFRRSLGDEVAWLEGRCVSFGRSIALHPLIDLLKRDCGIDEGEDEAAIAGKIETHVLALGEDMRPALPFVKYLLSVDPGDPVVTAMDPQHRRGEIFDVLRRLTARAAARRPHVLVFEDLHWVDQATEEYLLRIGDVVPTSRVLHICTYRPGYVQPFGDRTYHTRLVLASLTPGDSVALAERMLLSARLPEPLETLITAKAEGNPFFVEEVVKSLREAGALRQADGGLTLARPLDQIIVPDTIQDVIMARIDRLNEPSKRLLQIASVIGREFPRRLLDRVAMADDRPDDSLAELKSVELIYERAALPEIAYTFKHALTQEVAYASLLLQRRKALHERIAQAIEEVHADRLIEHYEVLAFHFRRAEAPRKALEYLMKAAEKAAKAFATRAALTLYDEAEEVAGALGDAVGPETRIMLYRAKADLCLLVSDFERARTEGERALIIARAAGDRRAAGSVLVGMGLASVLAHRFERALDDARQAIEVGEAADAPQVLAGGHLTTALVYEFTGRLEEAQEKFDQVITMSRAAGDIVNESWALVFAAELQGWEARFDEASRLYAAGTTIARAHDVLPPLLEGLFMWGINLTGQGEYDRALALLEDGLALAEKVGDENYTPRYLNSLGWLHMECGDLGRGRELNQRAAEGARSRRDDESIANADLNLGDIALARGDLALAGDLLEGVERRVNDPATSEWMRWRYSMHLFASLGELRLARGDPAAAELLADRCLDLSTRKRARKYLVRGWCLKGETALARKRVDAAEEAFRQALDIATAIGAPTLLWKTHAALGRLDTARGKPDAAHDAYAAARGVVERMMRQVSHAGLRAALETAEPMRRILDLGAPR